jgi:tetratricopeptide (TPR) repeat protein
MRVPKKLWPIAVTLLLSLALLSANMPSLSGTALQHAGQMAQVAIVLVWLLQTLPKPGDRDRQRCRALLAQDKLPEAAVACGLAVQRNPRNAANHLLLAKVLHRLHNFKGAIAAYHEAIRQAKYQAKYDDVTAPRIQATAYCGLGFVYQTQGSLQKALESFEQALLLVPNHPFAQQQYAAVQRLLQITG